MFTVDHCISANVEITRPANTTAYETGDIVNGDSATTLPKLSFGHLYANSFIEIYGATILTDYLTDASKMEDINLYPINASDINNGAGTPASVKTDNVAFCPSYSELKSKLAGALIEATTDISNVAFTDGGIVGRAAENISRIVQLDSSGDLYLAPVLRGAITPASGQKFYIEIRARVIS